MRTMSQPDVATAEIFGPVKDPNAARVCSLNGIGATRERLATLQQLLDGIEMSIRELERERKRDQSNDRALLVLRFTKATCDGFIGLASAISTAVLGKKVGEQAEF